MPAAITLAERSVQPPAPSGTPAGRSRAEKGALASLLLVTAAVYLWNLSVSGWANAFYSGATQAMTKDWTAFFFASTDAGNTVTVDKPPAALWVTATSARLFGVSSWSILVPQALIGVATVALLYAAVRRVSGPVAALVAGTAFGLTPVVVLMFRFNNPDALLTLLMVAAAYAVARAIEGARTRWLLLAGALIGLAFLTKTAQALLPLPALALAYLWAAPTGLWRRVRQLIAGGAVMVLAAGWWFLIAALWLAGTRPYIGGSTNNSAWQLALGYNGLGRLFGQGTTSGGGTASAGMAARSGGGMAGGGMGAGWLRMFGQSVGSQVAWLLPAALLLLLAGLVVTRRAPRTDRVRASLLLWGGWTLITGLTFSLMQGIFHQYYTVALAPGIAALVGVGGAELWGRRETPAARVALAGVVAVSGAWAWVLLGRTEDFLPWLRWVVIALTLVAVAAMFQRGRRAAVVAVTAAVVVGSLGPAAYASQTVRTAYTNGIPVAGPASAARSGGGMPGGGMPGGGAGSPGGRRGSVFGGLGSGDTKVSTKVVTLLKNAGTKWSAATINTSSSAALALASGTDVMGIGGFTGGDPAPTLAQFKKLVAAGKIHYFINSSTAAGRGGGKQASTNSATSAQSKTLQKMGGGIGMDSTGSGGQIRTWVQAKYTASTVGGLTVYDLTKART
jgi:4-amino-4-deoxy-L-arabinose transferase-like glycosyltransferase